MFIRDLRADETFLIEQVAALLVEGFREMAPDAWPTLDLAHAEVMASFALERISRVALDDDDTALSWIGGICNAYEFACELHLLVVAPAWQGRGGITLYLGTDVIPDANGPQQPRYLDGEVTPPRWR